MQLTKHTPILLAETLTYLNPTPNGIYLDGTLGGAGHARAILAASAPTGRLVGLDRDSAVIQRAEAMLKTEAARVILRQASYHQAPTIARESGIDGFDGILLDLGLSSDQLADPERGFSFQQSAPLDLRFDSTFGESAAEFLAHCSERELTEILHEYGELRAPHRLAAQILNYHKDVHPIETTYDLVAASGLKHPRRLAQLFQAVRIAVNEELEILDRALPLLWELLLPGGRMVILTFHSLEDRKVKNFFRNMAGKRAATILTKKPLTPAVEELESNPRSRSAKLRAAEKPIQI